MGHVHQDAELVHGGQGLAAFFGEAAAGAERPAAEDVVVVVRERGDAQAGLAIEPPQPINIAQRCGESLVADDGREGAGFHGGAEIGGAEHGHGARPRGGELAPRRRDEALEVLGTGRLAGHAAVYKGRSRDASGAHAAQVALLELGRGVMRFMPARQVHEHVGVQVKYRHHG